MLLIADSGSTKTDWRLLNAPEKKLVTQGLNPYYLSQEKFITVLREELIPQMDSYSVEEIYFYAAGVANAEKAHFAETAIQAAFPACKIVQAFSDLLGAARGLCGHEPGIACILGTGSNSCYYDGTQIVDNVPPCGFILGDEGSGAVMGRKLLSAFLKRDLPEELCVKLREEEGLSKDIILERIYREPFPNRFAAQYSRWILKHSQEPVIHKMITESFGEFFDRNVLKYSNAKTFPVHFTGSVAFYFESFLREAAQTREIQIGQIVPSPLNGMAAFHGKSIQG